jgi:hypothetical protein
LKKVMLLAAMLAMVMAATVPALAQGNIQGAVVGQNGSGNVACVQQAANTEVGKVQISQYGDNINIQAIAQQCNITVPQANTIVAQVTPSAPSAAQYQYKAAAAQYQYASASASASPSASASASAAPTLPPTGGSSLIALGAGVLLVAGGLLARRIVR